MSQQDNTIHRMQLLNMLNAAIERVRGDRCVECWLQKHPVKGPVHLVAIGKAAASMAQGALTALPTQIEEGLIITKKNHCGSFISGEGNSHIVCIEAAHPIPDQSSLDAGNRLLHFIQAIPLHSPVLILISGGTSALVEVLPQNVSLQDWRQVNQWLLAHSFSIDQINTVRKRISCIKGGRLAPYLADKRVMCLMISDVKDNDPSVIGSGMLAANRSIGDQDVDEAMIDELPSHIMDILTSASQLPVPNDPCFKSINIDLIATLQDAKNAAKNAALELGYEVFYHDEFVEGDAIEAGQALAAQLLQGPAGVHIWGGETIVELPEKPGRGGRNQNLALAAAQVLNGNSNVFFLAAGTDGTDGPGEDAGALVDGGTQTRGMAVLGRANQSIDWYLKNADAGTFLDASGDLIRTGPTGTNVMDLMVGLKI